MVRKTLVINGVTRILVVDENETLATVLREHLLLTGCKIGCGEGHCHWFMSKLCLFQKPVNLSDTSF